ncbi:hypothetical protein E0K83_06430 [Gramella sp. BOM4]|nr:hypothetical protein [Christiangramia bathymodioli]
MNLKITNYKLYNPENIIEEFSGEIQHRKMPTLVEYLSNPDKAQKIEAFKEIHEELYFYVENLWVKQGREFKSPCQVLSITEEVLLHYEHQELTHLIEYAECRVEASKRIIRFIKQVPALRVTNLYKSKRKWYFNSEGFKIPDYKVKSNFHKPMYNVRPSTPYKKDVISKLEKSKKKWIAFKEVVSSRIKHKDIAKKGKQ